MAAGDIAKLDFVTKVINCSVLFKAPHALSCSALQALDGPDPTVHQSTLEPDVETALNWMANLRPEEVIEERERVMRRIERRAATLVRTGKVEEWFAGCPVEVRMVAEHVNGPLMEELVKEAGHADTSGPDLFRKGL